MKKRTFKLSLITLLVSSISVTASAATLVDVEGSVTVNRLGNLFPASNNMEIKSGDIISVYEGSARLSNCSEKIAMNQAVEFVNEQACPTAKDLSAEFSGDQKVTLAAETAAAGSIGGIAGSTLLIAAGSALALGAIINANNNDNTPASP